MSNDYNMAGKISGLTVTDNSKVNLDQFDMFTPAGNAAVYDIVKKYEGKKVTEDLWHTLMCEMIDLSKNDGFKEAHDTAVSDGIWLYLKGDL